MMWDNIKFILLTILYVGVMLSLPTLVAKFSMYLFSIRNEPYYVYYKYGLMIIGTISFISYGTFMLYINFKYNNNELEED